MDIQRFLIFIGSISILVSQWVCSSDDSFSHNRYVIKFKHDVKHERDFFRHLENYNLTERYQITPATYIFEYHGPLETSELHHKLSIDDMPGNHKILEFEPVRVYDDDLKPESIAPEDFKYHKTSNELPQYNLVCDNYYGLGVSEVWSRGWTGEGVVIAVTDVGVDIQLLDLKKNIKADLSFNFVDDTTNVATEFFPNLQAEAAAHTDHGNMVASIIAAAKGNGICSAGIAYNSAIVALKIYKVKMDGYTFGLLPRHWSDSEIISKALKYKLDEIDIYANAWAPTKPFDPLDIATRDAIKNSAKKGRNGLGRIHVVPSGPPGNGLSNNIYTITVNSVDKHGTIPDYAHIDASVLTSGLGTGNYLNTTSMVTTSTRNKCVTKFKGVSAATAQLSAIIALALEANKDLTLRDIQHLLVHASERDNLQEKSSFRPNKAGLYFHDYFGFGLINVNKFVQLAQKKPQSSRMISKTLTSYNERQEHGHKEEYEFCNKFDCKKRRRCLTTIEHVEVQLEIVTNSTYLRLELQSPGGTRSVLMDSHSEDKGRTNGKPVSFVSVHFWGEIPFGHWLLSVTRRQSGIKESTSVKIISLIIYGTNNEAIANHQELHGDLCDKEMVDKSISSSTVQPPVISTAPSDTTTGKSNSHKNSDKSNGLLNVFNIIAVLFSICIVAFLCFKNMLKTWSNKRKC